jgi:FixJ family two-component response regulator
MSQPVVHIVDDDASERTALSRVLRYAGFEARGYASASPCSFSASAIT